MEGHGPDHETPRTTQYRTRGAGLRTQTSSSYWHLQALPALSPQTGQALLPLHTSALAIPLTGTPCLPSCMVPGELWPSLPDPSPLYPSQMEPGAQASTPGHWGNLGKPERGGAGSRQDPRVLGTYSSSLGDPPQIQRLRCPVAGEPGSGAGIPARPCLPLSHVASVSSSVSGHKQQRRPQAHEGHFGSPRVAAGMGCRISHQ